VRYTLVFVILRSKQDWRRWIQREGTGSLEQKKDQEVGTTSRKVAEELEMNQMDERAAHLIANFGPMWKEKVKFRLLRDTPSCEGCTYKVDVNTY